eukprot:TRINITY_DN807_c1_g1_i1.p1 TRINITY_DN807_c1_g1~~TRINITY_DN807_c1_g1_i1.p1  ORF type:complete len:110 (-),score=34.90 TRINITY_DN807_c1_g1_i1:115-414(-)
MSEYQHEFCDFCGLGPCHCIYACICPQCSMSQARSNYDDSNCIFNCCCICIPALRNIVREGYGIEGNCLYDILLSVFCYPCAIVQTHQEIKSRGARRGK